MYSEPGSMSRSFCITREHEDISSQVLSLSPGSSLIHFSTSGMSQQIEVKVSLRSEERENAATYGQGRGNGREKRRESRRWSTRGMRGGSAGREDRRMCNLNVYPCVWMVILVQ